MEHDSLLRYIDGETVDMRDSKSRDKEREHFTPLQCIVKNSLLVFKYLPTSN